ncbi:hypothetical protein SK854_13335 [Lentzea sp. BCCO 10_0061]|uniref:Uncharacterized protein n=1 Tax=Lentzea sokolovensis TaxID=3095429 RepID=A0ABU4UVS6_9PSEU|nr:hypothetical protein [Lentzea sp. BCCO 10_0061]MDX8143104.1 hypothetical protein [Lentzea sp. BCCO 10_0061]
MPRRRPVREQRTSQPVPQVARLSAAATNAIAAFERDNFHPGAVARSFATWSRFVHGPARAIVGYQPDDCGCMGCEWGDPVTSRGVLAEALRVLPGRSARELRALVRPLDELYLARSLPVPEHAHIRALLNA